MAVSLQIPSTRWKAKEPRIVILPPHLIPRPGRVEIVHLGKGRHVRCASEFGVSSSPVSSFSIEACLDLETFDLESTTPITSFHFPPHVLPPGAYMHLTYEQSRMSSEELLAYMRWLLPNVPAGSATWKELCQVTGAARIDCEDPVFREWEREWSRRRRCYY